MKPASAAMSFIVLVHMAMPVCSLMAQHSPRQTITWQDTMREYLVHAPQNYSADRPLPLLFFFHGMGGDISRYEVFEDFQAIADRYGWLVVLPQALPAVVEFMGYPVDLGSMWNADLAVPLGDTVYRPNAEVDDAGFVLALIDSLAEVYPVDRDSLFVSGVSLGGFFTHRLAIDYTDHFTAAAAVSGYMATPLARRSPSRHFNMMHIHGTLDNVVRYDGYSEPLIGMTPLLLGIGVDSTIAYWVRQNDCDSVPVVDTLPDRVDDGLRFVRYTYLGRSDSVRFQFIKVLGGEHEWYSDTLQHDVDYIAEIHRFFVGDSSFAPDIPTSGIVENGDNIVRVYPNPASDRVNVVLDHPVQMALLDVRGRQISHWNFPAGCSSVSLAGCQAGVYFLRDSQGHVAKLLVK